MDILTDILKIKHIEIINNKTYYELLDSVNSRTIVFDNICTHWMQELYLMVQHIAEERDKRNICLHNGDELYTQQELVEPKKQFFGLAETVADQLMFYFAMNELGASDGNRNLDYLCYHLLTCGRLIDEDKSIGQAKFTEAEYIQLKLYLERMVTEVFNAFYQASFFDFYISFWSEFESCINNICRAYETEIQHICNETQFKDMKKFLNTIYKDCEKRMIIDEQFLLNKENYLKKFPKYISFNDRYNYLFKRIGKDNYTRDQKRDREILEFCTALRNTLHNNGLHVKKDKGITIAGKRFSLKKMGKLYYNNYSDVFLIAKEIFDIYVAIFDGLEACDI